MDEWKKKLNIVYSTNPDYHYVEEEEGLDLLPNEKQLLRISLDRRNRKGKSVTLITGYVGSEDELKRLSKLVKTKCGVGGSIKDGEIIVQGDHRDKVLVILHNEGYAKSRII